MAIGSNTMFKKYPLAEELFDKIEAAQGFAYISDGLYGSNEKLFEAARCARDQHKKCVAILNRFLRKHGQPL